MNFRYNIPIPQGRAAEHLLARAFVKPGGVVLMNYHFTTTRAHFELVGSTVLELYKYEALNTQSFRKRFRPRILIGVGFKPLHLHTWHGFHKKRGLG